MKKDKRYQKTKIEKKIKFKKKVILILPGYHGVWFSFHLWITIIYALFLMKWIYPYLYASHIDLVLR